ncbi:MAG: enoyl-CoA hydratase/isomerase family protein [Gammaproteobacteria bacterium]|nr:enoyl-CoA hydratase/isomerase family protein [Gammaproteobacteria bacterium]
MKRGDIEITHEGHVAVVEIQRPPNNFFSTQLINDMGDTFEALDEDTDCRAILLCSEGKHFCAGRNFGDRDETAERTNRPEGTRSPLYEAAVRLFSCKKPIIGAIQGAAVGGGFGLALLPDFRVVCPQARFTANFVKLGFHPGFGLTYTLPRLIGQQNANLMFMTGRRINGETAYAWGMADVLTDLETLRSEALNLAAEIAENAPLAVKSVRATMRQGIAEAVQAATDREGAEQSWLQKTEDHREGVKAVAERRPGNFVGR